MLVPGAVSGVGIWFTIGLISPWATSTLIHVFVWAWATEWALFLLGITAALIYYYRWDHLSPRAHWIAGWIYFLASWGSLAVINGILSFMLTPGQWLETRSLRDGFFNPGMFPSLFLRTLVCLALAGLFGLVTASRIPLEDLRASMVRYASRWLLPSFLLMPLGGMWLLARLPTESRRIVFEGGPAVMTLLLGGAIVSILLFLLAWRGAYRQPASLTPLHAVLFVTLGFFATATTEWLREAVRKPYLIHGYMYANGFLKDEENLFRKTGVLSQARFTLPVEQGSMRQGQEVFRVTCRPCHTIRGYNGLAPMVRGWTLDPADQQLQRLEQLQGFMPPFPGNSEERLALARWLTSLELTSSEPNILPSGSEQR